ncbi:type IV pilus modification protein PilV [Halomonas koreensis]|uniref:Type IV pilus modification protein PilV n=1 Tax=Halomonas koreensis TaxID=245385 RepID=A0ABU1FZ60_9GAMM|nr:type IV pilus modification protein PilV [Halomonas koreensis]MDR5865963.1 type IV pilus modification protein PilV [Halomonas koreensis]
MAPSPHRRAARQTARCRPRASGFSLIEVLVALLLLSVGVLGLAGLQLESLQSSHVAYQRAIASLAAQDAQERLWLAFADKTERVESDEANCPTSAEIDATMGAPLADMSPWRDAWKDRLPGLGADPVRPATDDDGSPLPGCQFTITIDWQEGRFVDDKGNATAASTLDYAVRLPARVTS